MGLTQSMNERIEDEIEYIEESARQEAAWTLMDLATQQEQLAANIYGVPDGPGTPSSADSGSVAVGTGYRTGRTPNTHSTVHRSRPEGLPLGPFAPESSHRPTPKSASTQGFRSGDAKDLVGETPMDEHGIPIRRRSGRFRQPGFGLQSGFWGVEHDDFMKNQKGI